MISGDTIVAQATPFGYSGTALIRISGPSSADILTKLTGIDVFAPRVSTYSKITHKEQSLYLLFSNSQIKIQNSK